MESGQVIGDITTLLTERERVARGALRPLTESLRNDLTQLIQVNTIELPANKARLSRFGGRCHTHGTPLGFDPWSPHLHVCDACGIAYADVAHDRWWIMNYQLWLAERSVHAAVHGALTGDPQSCELAERILAAACDRYLTYPNRDNVLGPSRPFFSTYLESIWLLQLSVTLSVLRSRESNPALVQRTLDQVLEPSLALIRSFDEGGSNRQVWNNAAIIAAGTLLDERDLVNSAMFGASGLARHLTNELLADGTWYEGENYHLFAHRGLWYGVTMAQQLGADLSAEGLRRFREGFVAPFLTALPDMTFPARRDSQYGVSLRQWRTAESCELGLAFGGDERLIKGLQQLYDVSVPVGDSGRARSTAEAERNVSAARLTRASLGFKSLLYALPELPVRDAPQNTDDKAVHLEAQGYGVIRRDRGQLYVALDYGHSGGGHGHPDRLNLWLVHGGQRWLHDVGTGSYVDPSLFWYRSTLAHNAPMFAGQGQSPGTGRLIAWQARGAWSWLAASFALSPQVEVQRSLTVMEDYVVDELSWQAKDAVTIDLPWHISVGDGDGATIWHTDHDTMASLQAVAAGHLHSVERAAEPLNALDVHANDRTLRAWFDDQQNADWFRCVAPGPPGEGLRRFFIQRAHGTSGTMRSVWCWGRGKGMDEDTRRDEKHPAGVSGVRSSTDAVVVVRSGGGADTHTRQPDGWHIVRAGAHPHDALLNTRSVSTMPPANASGDLGGDQSTSAAMSLVATRANGANARTREQARAVLPDDAPLVIELGEKHYRRTEASWREAASPRARVVLTRTGHGLDLEVLVRKPSVCFASKIETNLLDNEHPDINSDGLQLYVRVPNQFTAAWIAVGHPDGSLRITVREGEPAPPPLDGRWMPHPDGYVMQCSLQCDLPRDFQIQLVVNETIAGRERRRGQLVLTGVSQNGEWAYLRGDREPTDAFLQIVQGD